MPQTFLLAQLLLSSEISYFPCKKLLVLVLVPTLESMQYDRIQTPKSLDFVKQCVTGQHHTTRLFGIFGSVLFLELDMIIWQQVCVSYSPQLVHRILNLISSKLGFFLLKKTPNGGYKMT